METLAHLSWIRDEFKCGVDVCVPDDIPLSYLDQYTVHGKVNTGWIGRRQAELVDRSWIAPD